jgi:hypothetical protein
VVFGITLSFSVCTAFLLRARPKRPRHRRAGEQRDELATDHSITSSARNKIEVGNSMPIALARKSR